jgi:hypothetical protein
VAFHFKKDITFNSRNDAAAVAPANAPGDMVERLAVVEEAVPAVATLVVVEAEASMIAV